MRACVNLRVNSCTRACVREDREHCERDEQDRCQEAVDLHQKKIPGTLGPLKGTHARTAAVLWGSQRSVGGGSAGIVPDTLYIGSFFLGVARRHVHCAGMGVPALKNDRLGEAAILSTSTPIPCEIDMPSGDAELLYIPHKQLTVGGRLFIE